MSSMFGPNRYARPVLDDTGWMDLTLTDTTNFENYVVGEVPQVRKVGGVVYLRGALRLLTATYIDTTTMRYFMTLPAGYGPSARTVIFVCQGSGSNHWSIAIEPDGDVSAQRFGPAASAVGYWLPFNVSWLLN